MKVHFKILTNTLYQLLAKIVSTLSTLLITVLITRKLGAATWGEYSIVIAYVTFFYVFSEFGLNSIAVRDFSKKKKIDSKKFFNFIISRFLNTLLIILISILILQFVNYSPEIKKAIYFSQIAVLFFSISNSLHTVFQINLKYKFLFYVTLIFAVINISSFVFILRFFENIPLIYLFVPMVLADFFRFVFSYIFASSFFNKLNFGISKNTIKYFFITAFPLGLALVFNTMMTQIDKFMLSVMVEPVFVGYYALSYRLFDVLLVLPTFFMNASFPIFVKKFEKGNYSYEFTASVVFLAIASLLITLVSVFSGSYFIPLIWGTEMIPAVYSFNILIAGSVLFFVSSPISWAYVVEDKLKYLIYFYLIGFTLNLVLNLVFIPKWNYIAAAYTTIFTELIILLMLEVYRRKVLKVKLTDISKKNLLGLLKIR